MRLHKVTTRAIADRSTLFEVSPQIQTQHMVLLQSAHDLVPMAPPESVDPDYKCTVGICSPMRRLII